MIKKILTALLTFMIFSKGVVIAKSSTNPNDLKFANEVCIAILKDTCPAREAGARCQDSVTQKLAETGIRKIITLGRDKSKLSQKLFPSAPTQALPPQRICRQLKEPSH